MDGIQAESHRGSSICDDCESSEYDFIATPEGSTCDDWLLPARLNDIEGEPSVNIEMWRSMQDDGILVTIRPPRAPAMVSGRFEHVPCDIVLTIDVSGSMSAEAPPPVELAADAERNGLTVLDLVKHAARMILETLNETDQLAIVTFSTDAKVVQRLLPMTAENKALSSRNIDSLQPDSMTNLWHGILESIKIFNDDQRANCASSIMILTDGLPNHMNPSQGFVRKIRTYQLPATLHTFGFGFSLRSGMLKSIAEVGGGNYGNVEAPTTDVVADCCSFHPGF